MRQMALNWSGETFVADLAHDKGGLIGGDHLRTDLIIALFTWARANDDDALPDGTSNRMGWWGDSFSDVEGANTGSKLWLLRREKNTAETRKRAEDYCREALQHLIDDGAASDILVNVERAGLDGVKINISVISLDGNQEAFFFDYAWEAEVGRIN